MCKLRERFIRTHCDCPQCVACCQTMPGALAPGDLELIAEHLHCDCDEGFVLEFFEASEGATVLDTSGRTVSVPSIVPKTVPGHGCVFLEHDGFSGEGSRLRNPRCRIHAVAPFACAFFDPHMSEEEGYKRSHALICAQAGVPAGGTWNFRGPTLEDKHYADFRRVLCSHGMIAAPLADRRRALNEVAAAATND